MDLLVFRGPVVVLKVNKFWAPKAVPRAETYHCAILRACPGEKGDVLIKKGGAKKDMDLLTLNPKP